MKRILVLMVLIALGHVAQQARMDADLSVTLHELAPPAVESSEL